MTRFNPYQTLLFCFPVGNECASSYRWALDLPKAIFPQKTTSANSLYVVGAYIFRTSSLSERTIITRNRVAESSGQGLDQDVHLFDGIVKVGRDAQPIAARRRNDFLALEVGIQSHGIDVAFVSNTDDLGLFAASS